MGTRFRVVVFARDESHGGRACERALDAVAEVEALASDWDPASPTRRLGDRPGEWQVVPESLFALLERSRRAHALSNGAFDPTVGPLTRLWRRALRQGEAPERETPERETLARETLERARAAVGLEYVTLDRRRRAVRFERPGMGLDFGGIAKGFALDRALAVLFEAGLERALVDGGGDLALGAPPPGRRGWRVRLDPFVGGAGVEGGAGARLELARVAVATSGDRYRGGELAGTPASHLMDPATGSPRAGGTAATVVARDGALADALASALCVSGARGLRALAAARAAGEVDELVDAWVFAPDGEVRRLGTR